MLSGTMPEPVTAAHKNSRGSRIKSIGVPAVFVQVFHYMIFQSTYSFRICPRHPRKCTLCGRSSDVRQLTGSMGPSAPPWFSPSRPSTEVSLCCGESSLMRRLLSGSYRPAAARILRIVSAFAAAVAPCHRSVPDEMSIQFFAAPSRLSAL